MRAKIELHSVCPAQLLCGGFTGAVLKVCQSIDQRRKSARAAARRPEELFPLWAWKNVQTSLEGPKASKQLKPFVQGDKGLSIGPVHCTSLDVIPLRVSALFAETGGRMACTRIAVDTCLLPKQAAQLELG